MIAEDDIYPGPNDINMPIPYDGSITKLGAFLSAGEVGTADLKFAVERYKETTSVWEEVGQVTLAAGSSQQITSLTTPVSVKAGERVRLKFIDASSANGPLIASVYYSRSF